jgi:hypothetical protein
MNFEKRGKQEAISGKKRGGGGGGNKLFAQIKIASFVEVPDRTHPELVGQPHTLPHIDSFLQWKSVKKPKGIGAQGSPPCCY